MFREKNINTYVVEVLDGVWDYPHQDDILASLYQSIDWPSHKQIGNYK